MTKQNDPTGSLPMHGVDEAGETPTLGHSLAAYVRQVATVIGVPADGTSYEESDTATAYVGLPHRVPDHPERDLMLVWDERLGWRVETEPGPEGPATVLGRLRTDPVPPPSTVAGFVADVVAGIHTPSAGPAGSAPDRATLARLMDDADPVDNPV
jgi:uncharacterized protein DUF6292